MNTFRLPGYGLRPPHASRHFVSVTMFKAGNASAISPRSYTTFGSIFSMIRTLEMPEQTQATYAALAEVKR
jgi:hypothetical protein